jgi:hypothetical protein
MKIRGKYCWVAKETRTGWKLFFSIGKHDYALPVIFQSVKAVKQAISGNIVFVEKER